jgi:UDP-3-O-[3-hydroxymyristoyl] glucosamine N-acyltransferase
MLPSGVPLPPRPLEELVRRHGGSLRGGAHGVVRRLVPVRRAAAGDLAPLLALRYVDDALAAAGRGAFVLVDQGLADRAEVASLPGWFHPFATYALAELLDSGDAPADEPSIGEGCTLGPGVILLPRVRLGNRVTVGAGAVIGDAGFGFAPGPGGALRAIPHLGGVVIEDDVFIGALSTIAAGTLSPTVVRRSAKLDAQVHVGHNCEIGEGAIIAAQSGLAGSVTVGRGALLGGQVGVADHLVIGDGARVAAKSGVIGDVPPGATVAGYPAVDRQRWLRGLAELYRLVGSRASSVPPPRPNGSSSRPPPAASPAVRSEAVIRRSEPPRRPGEP